MASELPTCGVCSTPIAVGAQIIILAIGVVEPITRDGDCYEDNTGDFPIGACGRACLMRAIAERLPIE